MGTEKGCVRLHSQEKSLWMRLLIFHKWDYIIEVPSMVFFLQFLNVLLHIYNPQIFSEQFRDGFRCPCYYCFTSGFTFYINYIYIALFLLLFALLLLRLHVNTHWIIIITTYYYYYYLLLRGIRRHSIGSLYSDVSKKQNIFSFKGHFSRVSRSFKKTPLCSFGTSETIYPVMRCHRIVNDMLCFT